MKASRALPTLLMLCATALLLAGCGGTSKAEYQKQVRKIINKVESDTDKVFTSGQPSRADMEKAGAAISKAADDLDDLSPPSDVKDLHDDMVEDIRTLGDALTRMAPALEKMQKDPSRAADVMKEIESEQKKVIKATERLERTQKAFEKKGYKFGEKKEK